MKTNTAILLGSIAALLLSGSTAYLFSGTVWVPYTFLGLAVAGILYYLWAERSAVAGALGRRTTQYGLNSVLMGAIAIVITIVVNLIVNGYDKKIDFTKNRVHTLSEQSVKVLKNLKSEVRLRAFVNPQQQADYQKVFDKYTYVSKMIKPDFVDVDRDPGAVQRYNVKNAGTLVFETDARSVKVDNLYSADDPKVEEKLTNAIISVTKGDKKKICVTTGHGEKLMSDTARYGYSDMKEALEGVRYKIDEVSLAEKGAVPNDCEMLVSIGPKSEFVETELKAIEGYLKAGGKALFMVEPDSSPNLKELFAKFGVDWKAKDTILETNALQQFAGGNPVAPVVKVYDGTHEITKELKQMSIFPTATPVEKATNVPAGYTVTSLFSTSGQSYEIPYAALMKGGRGFAIDEKNNRKGPLSLAVAVTGKAETAKPAADPKKPEEKAEEKKDSEFRLVVVGDSDFANNSVRRFFVNADLFQNMVSWLSKDEDLIAIRPKSSDTSELNITENRFRWTVFTAVIFAPLACLIFGFSVWFFRRRL